MQQAAPPPAAPTAGPAAAPPQAAAPAAPAPAAPPPEPPPAPPPVAAPAPAAAPPQAAAPAPAAAPPPPAPAPQAAPAPPRPAPFTVAVIGAGTMGSGIAQLAILAGNPVRLFDVDPAAVARTQMHIADTIGREAARRGMGADQAASAVANMMTRLVVAADPASAVEGAAIAIEAVAEDLAVKQELFRALDAASPSAILATNTSALSVAAIASVTSKPARVVGLHFFNPVGAMALVEVVAAAGTDPGAITAATRVVTGWGKTAVRSADTPGFIVNRVNRGFTLQALRMLEEGLATVPRIDSAIKILGFPMGPFELMDLIGIDVNLAAARGVYEGFGQAPRFRPSPIQEQLVAAGTLGRKTGSGFYTYDESGKKLQPAPGIPGGDVPDFGMSSINERIVHAIVNEAYRALGDGVASEADIDTALKLGAGHPIGPFERAARLGGPKAVASALTRLTETYGPDFEPAPALLAAIG